LNARVSVIVTQRERFGMTSESLDSLVENTPGTTIIYVDGNSPDRWARYLREKADEGVIELIRLERYLTPNQARNIGVKAAETEFVAFVDNDVVFTEGWLDTLVQTADETGADIVAPLTCQGLPFHTEIHHAGGDYAANGDISGFFAASEDRAYKEVMHGHGKKVADLAGQLHRTETGMCEFHCVMARRDVFDRFGPLDEKLLSTKEHIDFSMTVRKNGGKVVFEPASVVTYVFPCRARPMTFEDWPFFSLRWSDSYGRRSLRHFIEKWKLQTSPNYVATKRGVYAMRRMQGVLIPLMRKVPVLGRREGFVRGAARAFLGLERVVSDTRIWLRDRSRGPA
jgi:GT2 family glycosyltransferase